ncbi:Shedu immune nuclease family protein [Mucilaginibacter sp. PAMB04168]|uniref:Shedu immune nuclease family protein n=1 Tax=Mucilaginibacter sp. PAMB04168 TaxID=3138567 RepID=UPI0031F620AC
MAKTVTPVAFEYEKAITTNKKVFYFKDDEFKIDRISKEIYLQEDKEVHYPTPFRGEDKYKTIKKFVYIGFKKKLPSGVYKVSTFGYGFTKVLAPVISYLNANCNFSEVIIAKGGSDNMDIKDKKLFISDTTLQKLFNAFSAINGRHKEEKERAALHELNQLFPAIVPAPKKRYVPGTLTAALSEWQNALTEFNDSDKSAIKDLFDKLTLLPNFFLETNLIKTKEIIDNKFIQASLIEFDALMKASSDTPTLEKKWQAFLKKNSWVFSTLFAQPVILHQDEAYVGGKDYKNKNGKYSDFLIKNGLSDNVSFVEIKTHLTELVEKKPYRGDDVFALSKELTGCISQVLNQRDHFQKEFYSHAYKTKDVQTLNSKALIIIGKHSTLSEKQLHAFEMFRNNCKDVEIITFDELHRKIESLLKIMTGKI